jgi:hypothetical protein
MIPHIFHMVVCYGKDGAVLVSYFSKLLRAKFSSVS